ncbi:hypothetical protein C0992_000878 [Termitomyces sp. T32_za158]|nr:hypothetical protein C0992_000878 [Termitomyces sp. T32_za158]
MHGVKRVQQSAQALEAKRLREKAKLDDYLSLTQDVLSRFTGGNERSVNKRTIKYDGGIENTSQSLLDLESS